MLRPKRTDRLTGPWPRAPWLAKLGLGALAGIVLLSVLYAVLLPTLMARIDMKAGMAATLSMLTGGEVESTGNAALDLWPHPSFSLDAVTLTAPGQPQPFARIGRITADFDLIDALLGRLAYADFTLTDPVVSIGQDAEGRWNLPDAGQDGAGTINMVEPAIGTITIENGTLDVSGGLSGGQFSTPDAPIHITGVSGTIRWPTPSAMLKLALTATMNGEALDLSLTSDTPKVLFSGEAAPLTLALSSRPLTLGFEGTASFGGQGFWKGALHLFTPSAQAVPLWWNLAASSGTSSGLGPLGVDAEISGTRTALRFDDLRLSLGTASATGVLDLQGIGAAQETAALPHLAGTLAFDSLAFDSLNLFTGDGQGLTAALQAITADLRLSVRQLTAGPLLLTDVAAGIMTSARQATLDLGDSTFADGTLTGRLAIPRGGAGTTPGGKLQFLLRDADLDRLAALAGAEGPVPSGRGTLAGDLAGIGAGALLPLADSVTGTLRFSADSGRIASFDLPAFLDRAAGGQFFALSDAARGSFDYTGIDASATLDHGAIRIGKAAITGTEAAMTLSGVVRPESGSLAIAGRMTPSTGTLKGGLVRFFAGGAWPDLTITPLSVLSEPQ